MTDFSAEIVGEYPNQKLNLVLPRGLAGPRGLKGDTGATGPVSTVPGPQGVQGVQGEPGDMVSVVGPFNVTGAISIDASDLPTTRKWTLTGNATVTLPTPPATLSGTITLVLKQDATGGRTITWPAGLLWTQGIEQQPATAANSLSIIHLLWTGDEWVGLLGGKSFA